MAVNLLLDGEQGFYGVDVILLLKRVDEVEPLVDLFLSAGIEVYALQLVADVGGNVFQVYVVSFHTRCQFAGRSIDTLYGTQLAGEHAQAVDQANAFSME